jgi:hypothetical protein
MVFWSKSFFFNRWAISLLLRGRNLSNKKAYCLALLNEAFLYPKLTESF